MFSYNESVDTSCNEDGFVRLKKIDYNTLTLKLSGKLRRLIPILTIGLLLNYELIKHADDENVFNSIVTGCLLTFFLFVLIWFNLKDNTEYKQTKSKLSFIPTIVGFCMILSLIGTDYCLKARDNSPVLIQAVDDGGFNSAWFEFREDGTYKFVNSAGIGASYFRGRYTLKDSIITLDKANIDNAVKTKVLVIREIKNNNSTVIRMLYQINDKHEIANEECVFVIW